MLFHHKNPGSRHFKKSKGLNQDRRKGMTTLGVKTGLPNFKNKIVKCKKGLRELQFNIRVLEYHLLTQSETSSAPVQISVLENIEQQVVLLQNQLHDLKSDLTEKKNLEQKSEKHLHLSGIHCEEKQLVDKNIPQNTEERDLEELEEGELSE